MFPWDLCCEGPCTHCEPQPTSACPRAPALPLGWSLDLLWALWGPPQTLIWPISRVCWPQSPKLPELGRFHLWEHSLSTQMFHRCRVFLADCVDLICSLYS